MASNKIKRILRGVFKALIAITLIIGSLVIIKRAAPSYISTSRAFLNLHQDSSMAERKIRAIYLHPRFNGTMILRAMGEDGELFRSNILAVTAIHGSPSITGDIYSYGYPVTIKRMPLNVITLIVHMLLRFVPLVLYIYFSGLRFRRIFSPQFKVPIDKNFTLDNVIGQEHVKKLVLQEIEYILFKKKMNIRAKQSGMLFYGPPGTGKTMFVKGLAGTILQKGIPCKLLSLSGGGISELYVGSGPAKIRKLFDAARSYSEDNYVLVFIDEVEAMGSRETNQHQHSNNNIAELLAQMDGVQENRNIICIFATNYMDRVDSALLRPGRVDLQIRFGMPSFGERYALAKSFLPKKHSITDTNLKELSRMTSRYPHAFSKSLFRYMKKKLLGKKAKYQDLLDAYREITMGPEVPQNPLDRNDLEKRRTAFHEAGHAFVLAVFSFKTKFFKNFQKTLEKDKKKQALAKITKSIGENMSNIYIATVIPRSGSLGMVMYIPKFDNSDVYSAANMIHAVCFLGGNAAEKCLNGAEVASGCSVDFRQARARFRRHILYMFGVNDGQSGTIEDDPRQLGEYDRQIISTKTGQLMKLAYDFTIELLENNWVIISAIAEELLKKQEIPGSRIYDIIDQHKPNINIASFKKMTDFFLRVQ